MQHVHEASATPDLERFVAAQASVYPRVIAELAAIRKQTHWMWFVFPQIAGLGSSEMAQHFALSGIAEAAAYYAHPVLGPRLRECTELVLQAPPGTQADEIFPYPDTLKFRSCLTLFREAVPDEPLFRDALDRYFEGAPDAATLRLLDRQAFAEGRAACVPKAAQRLRRRKNSA